MVSDSQAVPSAGKVGREKDVTVHGVGMTTFTDSDDRSLFELLAAAGDEALTESGIGLDTVDSLHVGNMASAAFNNRTGLANALAGHLGLSPQSACDIGNTSASGASAFLNALHAVRAGRSTAALVVAGEKMSTASTETSTDIIGRITHEQEYAQGVTLPSFAGLAARQYLDAYEGDRRDLAEVAVKNHRHAARNPRAQFRSRITVDDVLGSQVIAEPLRLFDCCPITDGAAAVVLTAGPGDVKVSGAASAVGTHPVADRDDLLEFESVRVAGQRAYADAGCGPRTIDIAAVHDAFTILEWLELEALGFADRGEGWRHAAMTAPAVGNLLVNPGGGLKGRGHPLGATGVAQIVELVWQLRGDAPATEGAARSRTVDNASRGIALNVAGFGNQSVCTVLEGS